MTGSSFLVVREIRLTRLAPWLSFLEQRRIPACACVCVPAFPLCLDQTTSNGPGATGVLHAGEECVSTQVGSQKPTENHVSRHDRVDQLAKLTVRAPLFNFDLIHVVRGMFASPAQLLNPSLWIAFWLYRLSVRRCLSMSRARERTVWGVREKQGAF